MDSLLQRGQMIRPFINRLRQTVIDRRASRRCKAQRSVRLLFNVSPLDTPGDSTRLKILEGYTRDISQTGLSLIVPSLRSDDTYLTDANSTLRIVLLDLPTGRIEIHAIPVRWEQLAEPESGHLIGVQIKEMSESDRALLVKFLDTLP